MSAEEIPQGTPGCNRCEKLHDQARFWRDQQKFAASVAADLADLNDHDQQVAKLRSLLAQERDRRKRAEGELAAVTYRLQLAEKTQA